MNMAYALIVKTQNWMLAPSVQRLIVPILLCVSISLAIPYFTGEAPTVAEFDAIPAMFSLLLALGLIAGSPVTTASRWDNTTAVALAVLFVFPSFQTTLLASLLCGCWLFLRGDATNRGFRNAGIILIIHAVMAFTTFYSLKWFAEPLLAFDAMLVAGLLQVVTGTGQAIGNVYFGAADHQVLMLRNCSSLPAICSAIACWFAISRWHGICSSKREGLVLLGLFCILLVLNVARLFTMGISMQWHDWWHSPEGEDMYLTATALTTLAVIFGGLRYAETK
ncbi:hypothetical protein [Enterovibrio coralii]|uniref:Exosortase n=1 Tax=Enterovibrio coralii TaxID=294935 RepID=A0A135IDU4_9GAMM|nr:hypothetical protein [Enterovibrio coralii]KXF83514.1 hypothetical protein ATN88_16715 [Enterovibrio coralii]